MSKAQTAKVEFPNYDITLTRNELDDVLGSLLKRCQGPIRMAIKEAGLEASAIDHVLLVGGPTHMPCVRRVVRDELASLGARREVLGEIDGIEQRGFPVSPMECVCRGAALKAAGVVTPACTSMSQGLGTTYGLYYGPIIKENSMYPIDGKRSLTFPDPNAKTVTVELVEKRFDPDRYGESTAVFRYERLGRFTLSVIPTGELHTIELVLSVSKDKTLTATLNQDGTDIHVTYQKPDSLQNEMIELIDDGNIPRWDDNTCKANRAKYNRETSAWTKKELGDCVQKAMSLLELTRDYHHEKLQEGVKALQLSVGSVSYTNPGERTTCQLYP